MDALEEGSWEPKVHGLLQDELLQHSIKRLFTRGISKREIAKRLKIGRTSVRRVLTQKDSRP
jgi:DNA invertase Pin-like site-specific DNA recombinase